MRKLLFLVLSVLISSSLYAEGFTGIFGIDFGTESKTVKNAMTDKGWKLSETKNEELTYTKDKGTYGNLPVEKIVIFFFEDKFYAADIHFSVNLKPEDVAESFKAIMDTYSLSYVDNEETTYLGATMLTNSYIDPESNIFNWRVLVYQNSAYTWFELKNFKINNKKEAADKKKQQKEKDKKNKSISSDL